MPDLKLLDYKKMAQFHIDAREGNKAMKANIRRICPWLSLLMLLSLAIAACGGGTSSSQGQTLHVLIGYSSTYPSQQKQWMQQIGSEFQKATGSTITWDTFSSSNEEQKSYRPLLSPGAVPIYLALVPRLFLPLRPPKASLHSPIRTGRQWVERTSSSSSSSRWPGRHPIS